MAASRLQACARQMILPPPGMHKESRIKACLCLWLRDTNAVGVSGISLNKNVVKQLGLLRAETWYNSRGIGKKRT